MTAKTPLMDFANECGIKSAAEDALLIHAKASQKIYVFHYLQKTCIGGGVRSGRI